MNCTTPQRPITGGRIPEMPKDLYNISNISRAELAAITLKLQEQGILDADDTLEQWLSEIASQIIDGENLTELELLAGLKQFLELN